MVNSDHGLETRYSKGELLPIAYFTSFLESVFEEIIFDHNPVGDTMSE